MANLYWQDSGSEAWEDPLNWWTDAGATIQADNAPWVDGVDATYLDYNLTLALGATNAPTIGVSIGTDATGTCNIASTTNNGNIYGGTFTGDGFSNQGNIYGGTFSGSGFNNGAGPIYGGTFTGDNFINYSGINGGTFSGSGFNNNGPIYGGTFSGSGVNNNGPIYGGTFGGEVFTGTGYLSYFGIYFIGGSQTPLDSNGNGYNNNDGSYYIGGVATTLDINGNGDWNGSHYQNGGIFTDGYDYNNGIYYIGGQGTSLDSGGNGSWNSGFYSVGSLVGVALSLLPTASQVQSGVTYGNGLTGTLATETPIPQEWDNYAYYGQGAVVAYDDSLWLLASIGGWTVGGRPDLGYGWQKLFTGGGSTGAPASPINIAQLIGLPAFIQL
jgi:hypothetical protein